MFHSNEHTLKEVIRELIDSYRLGGKLGEMDIVKSWTRVTGPVITKHTRKIRMKNGTLFVTVDSAALRSELHYSRSKLIEMLNEQAGQELVKDIVFQ